MAAMSLATESHRHSFNRFRTANIHKNNECAYIKKVTSHVLRKNARRKNVTEPCCRLEAAEKKGLTYTWLFKFRWSLPFIDLAFKNQHHYHLGVGRINLNHGKQSVGNGYDTVGGGHSGRDLSREGYVFH